MKLVILAAGKGTRLYPLTKDVPKALVPIKDKKLIDYVLSPFLSSISEIIFIINDGLGFKIEEYITDNYHDKKVKYVIQTTEDLKGTMIALEKAKNLLQNEERFCVCNCDDLFNEQEIQKAIESGKVGIGISKSVMPWNYLGIRFNEKSLQVEGFERHTNEADLVEDYFSNGFHILTPEIFSFKKELAGKDEYGLPQTLFANLDKLPLHAFLFKNWQPVNSLEDLEMAQNIQR